MKPFLQSIGVQLFHLEDKLIKVEFDEKDRISLASIIAYSILIHIPGCPNIMEQSVILLKRLVHEISRNSTCTIVHCFDNTLATNKF